MINTLNSHDQSKILIVDFGSQYTPLIARRIRECGLYCELLSCDAAEKTIHDFSPNGIILSGGPETVRLDHTPRAPKIIFELDVPVLGICYGMQTMAAQCGGVVERAAKSEFGLASCEFDATNLLFQNISQPVISVWMSHGDHVTTLPQDFRTIAKTINAPIAAIAHRTKPFYGVQFHPEVTQTQCGQILLENFVKNICGCQASWTPNNIIHDAIFSIRETVQQEKVLLGLSGGVDSCVLAALLHQAIADQLMCVFVDTGLLRKNEGDEVMRILTDHFGVKIIRVNAKALFLEKLHTITDPEMKRKVIGNTFIDVFSEEAKKLQGIKFLAQGTIYSDVIESAHASTTSHVIKSHHNVAGLPEKLHFTLLEPLRELFKDEVRALGVTLGLPQHIIDRHPFPGPGLGVRILGEICSDYIEILQAADDIFIAELRKQNLYHQVSQAFAVFLPIKSVGVKGDARAYEFVIALRAVKTTDFMTAEWAQLPHAFLARVSERILNEVSHVSRVVYDISGKPPATIEWE